MFTKAFKECFITVLIALSFAATGIVFSEAVANSLNHTYNPFSQVEENND